MAHTPGPWNMERIGNDIEISAQTDYGHLSVAWVHMGNVRDSDLDEGCISDAHLIAAAPDLLEALKELMEMRDKCFIPNDNEWWDKKALSAIAKVEGK